MAIIKKTVRVQESFGSPCRSHAPGPPSLPNPGGALMMISELKPLLAPKLWPLLFELLQLSVLEPESNPNRS